MAPRTRRRTANMVMIIDNLGSDLLHYILATLDWRELRKASLVCRDFRRLAKQCGLTVSLTGEAKLCSAFIGIYDNWAGRSLIADAKFRTVCWVLGGMGCRVVFSLRNT